MADNARTVFFIVAFQISIYAMIDRGIRFPVITGGKCDDAAFTQGEWQGRIIEDHGVALCVVPLLPECPADIMEQARTFEQKTPFFRVLVKGGEFIKKDQCKPCHLICMSFSFRKRCSKGMDRRKRSCDTGTFLHGLFCRSCLCCCINLCPEVSPDTIGMAHLPDSAEPCVREIPLRFAVQENVHKNRFNGINGYAALFPFQILFVVSMDRHRKDMCPYITIMEFAK